MIIKLVFKFGGRGGGMELKQSITRIVCERVHRGHQESPSTFRTLLVVEIIQYPNCPFVLSPPSLPSRYPTLQRPYLLQGLVYLRANDRREILGPNILSVVIT